jgi:hypothetical protein
MGYGNYSQDVARDARSSNSDAFTYQGYDVHAGSAAARREVHPSLNPYQQIRECRNTTPIVVAMDVTRSRGNDSRIMYEKLPMFIGQIEAKSYAEGAAISFAAIGDVTCDQAPLQISQFEADNRLDKALSSFWLEEGGGGTGQESYEMIAYYYARKTKIEANERGEKGYFFFVGDEGFYPKVSGTQVKRWIGDDLAEDIDSGKIFEELQKKFHVFFIYPKKTWEERKSDIDAEIRRRVEGAGGQYANVDVRASLIWNNRNDLDLHVIAPSGEEIFYAHKQSACKGWLDVDMNVQGETTKPVENVRWSQGQAPKGHYKVFVQNYRFHELDAGATPFRVEVEVAGEIRHFDGVAGAKKETGPDSNVMVYEFDFDPAVNRRADQPESSDQYAGYHDEVILEQWKGVLPEEHILRIDDPGTIVDVMLGALSLVSAGNDLNSFVQDLESREQVAARVSSTRNALEGLSRRAAGNRTRVSGLPAPGGEQKGGSSRRL